MKNITLFLFVAVFALLGVGGGTISADEGDTLTPGQTNVVNSSQNAQNTGRGCGTSFLGLPVWYKYLDYDTTTCDLEFEFREDIPKVVLALFEIVLRLGGVAAVVMVMTGGVQYIISQGEPDKIKGARTTIINALVGLVIAMMSVVIVNFIGGSII